MLSLFAFSQENWQRPADEIDALMSLLQEYIAKEMQELRDQGVQVRILGDIDRLTGGARAAVDRIIAATGGRHRPHSQSLHLVQLAGGDHPRRAAARRSAAAGRLDPGGDRRGRGRRRLYTAPCPDPDLLIRTSGEMRISNFLLWQLAYAEFYVTPVLWPDFTRRHLFEAILEFQRRDRRFGRVTV